MRCALLFILSLATAHLLPRADGRKKRPARRPKLHTDIYASVKGPPGAAYELHSEQLDGKERSGRYIHKQGRFRKATAQLGVAAAGHNTKHAEQQIAIAKAPTVKTIIETGPKAHGCIKCYTPRGSEASSLEAGENSKIEITHRGQGNVRTVGKLVGPGTVISMGLKLDQ